MAPLASTKRVPDLQALLGLWRGDEESLGYLHEGLAREICRALRPNSELELFYQLYPGCEPVDVDMDQRKTVSLAFSNWTLEKRRK